MRQLVWFGILIGLLGLTGMEARAAEMPKEVTIESLAAQVQAQQHLIEELQRELGAVKQQRADIPAAASVASKSGLSSWPERSAEFLKRGEGPSFGGVATKPFLAQFGRAYLGGYADIEFRDPEDGNAEFDQHRLVPFIYADVTDRVKFATEIEIEHGGPDSPGGGEVKVEFATIDYLINESVNLRGGILLSPLGKVNLVHDSPLQDLTDRPLVNTNIIPTTLSEAGMGVFGSFEAGSEGRVDYEAYLVNGFNGTTGTATNISRASGLRSARGSTGSDNNDNPAFVGRLAYSPFLGLEIGGSTHLGDYDETGGNFLGIFALDTTYQHGPFELLAEGAYASIGRNDYALSKGVPDDLYGYYLQGNYHFLPSFLQDWAPKVFTDEATFTFVNRWDWINLDGNRSGRYTVGLNFRPTEDTVLKADFQFNQESGLRAETDDNEFILSAATYF